MKPLLNSTNRKRLVQVLGLALIVLAFYAMLTAIVLLASFVLLQKGITPELPWISSIQKYVHEGPPAAFGKARRVASILMTEVIYKPKMGACQFNNVEFDHLELFRRRRFTGKNRRVRASP
jgi:hypothetical protein